jgi:hypothetical protein
MTPGPAPTAACKACRAERSAELRFVGALCRPCYNAARRQRYRYDPFYRYERRRHTVANYDRARQRQRMRDYRAARKSQQSQEEGDA